jgi:HlyD family secretion protein
MSTQKRVFILIAAVAILAAIVAFSANANRKSAVSVQIGRVEPAYQLIARVNASGEIKPKEYVELQAEISGVITELAVREGDFVSKGDVLLKIDPTQTEAQTRGQQALLEAAFMDAANANAQIALQQANVGREKANVRAADAEVLKATQAVELSNGNFIRKQELFEQNLISRDLYEAAKNDKVAARSNLISAQARVEQAKASLNVAHVVLQQAGHSHGAALSRVDQNQAALAQAQDSLSKTVIRSPLTGVITQLNVEVGERAVPGTLNNPAATIMVIADLSIIEAELEVNETDIVAVELNQSAVVNVDALPDEPLEGIVTEIGNSAIQKQSSQEAKEFKVAIRLAHPPSALRPGLSCTADITTATRKNVLTIPIQALVVREFAVDNAGNPIKEEVETNGDPESREEFEGVFVVRERRVEFTPVKTGISSETRLQILSGVEEGSEIVTGSYKALRELKDGDFVKPQSGKKG